MGPASSRDPEESGEARDDAGDDDEDTQQFKEELYARARAIAALRRDTVSRVKTEWREQRKAAGASEGCREDACWVFLQGIPAGPRLPPHVWR